MGRLLKRPSDVCRAFKMHGPAQSDRVRRIARDLADLSTSLPLSENSVIAFRYHEGHMELGKVLITGPAGTPYAYGEDDSTPSLAPWHVVH